MTTVLGALRLERAYYHCPACNAGFHPRDRALAIEGGSLSPGAVRMTGLAAARASFAETGTLLHDLAGVNVDAKQAERTAEALGREIAADEREVVAVEPGRAPTMYPGMDSTGVPVRRAELAGRAGKQADGSARTREAKLVAVWAGAVDARGRDLPEREPGSVSYSAAVESAAARDTDAEPSPFARRVEREARRRGFDRASRQVVIGDGALWIWNIADMSFPDAVQIVDLFHAKQHLWDVAKAIYGPDTDTAERWAKRRRDELDDGRIGALLAALRITRAATRPADASGTSGATATACSIRSSAPWVCASAPASSRPAASTSSEPGANAPACIGPSTASTPSPPCAAASSATASTTSGSGAKHAPPPKIQQICRAPHCVPGIARRGALC